MPDVGEPAPDFELLSDTGEKVKLSQYKVAELYGTWQLKKFMGREYMGVARTTFLIDEAGVIRRVFENVRPDGHSSEVLAAL
jgi:peroxiredoxin Q/BCP